MKQILLVMFCFLSLSVLGRNLIDQTDVPTSDTKTSQQVREKEQLGEKQKMEAKDEEYKREKKEWKKRNQK